MQFFMIRNFRHH